MYYFNQWLIDLPQLAQAYNYTSHVDAGRWGWDPRMDHGAGGLDLQSAWERDYEVIEINAESTKKINIAPYAPDTGHIYSTRRWLKQTGMK